MGNENMVLPNSISVCTVSRRIAASQKKTKNKQLSWVRHSISLPQNFERAQGLRKRAICGIGTRHDEGTFIHLCLQITILLFQLMNAKSNKIKRHLSLLVVQTEVPSVNIENTFLIYAESYRPCASVGVVAN